MDFLKKPIFVYIGMALAAIAMVLGVIKPEWASYAWTVAGFLGFGSIDLLRSLIDSKGWKTHAVFIVVGLSTLAQLVGWITPEVYQAILVVFAPIIGITFQQALAKSSASVPKLTG